MKISDGNWLIRSGFEVMNPAQVYQYRFENNRLTVFAAIKEVLSDRSRQINTTLLTYELYAPRTGIIAVRFSHHQGVVDHGPHHELEFDPAAQVSFVDSDDYIELSSGQMAVRFLKDTWQMQVWQNGCKVTSTEFKSTGYITATTDEARAAGAVGTGGPGADHYCFERLNLGVGEIVYGLGERFTSFTKNGQQVDMWNRDGGTSTEQAYKNIPFYMTNKGYGVMVNHSELVSFEVGSEKVSKVQFSVPGESLEYFLISGPTMKDVLVRYTDLTGKPALPPAWSFGLWLTTSFTTNYDEKTVTSFIDGMAERDLPLRVFHFDCFWMEGFEWCNFTWDKVCFPDPVGMLKRLHEQKHLKICVWINPYIGQKSPLFKECMEKGYLLRRPNGDVWQWDLWQSGQGIVDFTNPDAVRWYQDKLRTLVDMGVDCFKTDFGERIPTDCVYFDHSDVLKMHNFYTYLYNKAVFEVLEEKKGKNNAVLFARSACTGGQKFPAHWGGDCYATYESMAETLRGGLSLAMSGFSFWSHDIGGFENTAPADIYKRWCAFGLLSSHSRLHGSTSYRVPWNYDDEACDVLRFFTKLKCSLMPYLYNLARISHESGIPMMRPMALEFDQDLACSHLETQYMFGDRLLVAPVFREDHEVDFYLPEGKWTSLINGEVLTGGRYYHQKHDYLSLPLLVRENTLLARGAVNNTPDYDYTDGTCFELFELQDGAKAQAQITTLEGKLAYTLTAARSGNTITFTGEGTMKKMTVLLHNVAAGVQVQGAAATVKGNDLLLEVSDLHNFKVVLA